MRTGWIVALAIVALAMSVAWMFHVDDHAADPQEVAAEREETADPDAARSSDASTAIVRTTMIEPALVPPKVRGAIAGRLVDLAGDPVADVAVLASISQGEAYWASETVVARSDVNGRFRFGDLVAGFHYELAIAAKPYGVSDGVRAGRVPRAAELDLGDLTLVERVRVRGTVVDLAGNPLAGVVVEPDRPGLDASDPTSTEGRFEVEVIPGQDVILVPRKPGYVSDCQSSDLVIVGPGESVAERTLRMRGTRPLRGLVVDQKGRPIADAKVEIDALSAHLAAETYDAYQEVRVMGTTTDSAGRFDGRAPFERGAKITATSPTRETRSVVVAADVEDCRIEIQLDPLLRVRCVDATNGATLRPRALVVFPAWRTLSSWVGIPASQEIAFDADGSARIKARASGGTPMRIAAWVDDYLLSQSDPIEIEVDGGVQRDELLIPMRRGGRVEGRVVEVDGTPAQGVRIFLKPIPHAENQEPLAVGASRSDGDYRISSLAAGRYEFFGVRGAETTPVSSPIEVAENSLESTLELRFAPSGMIVGLVHDGGTPLPIVSIRSVATDGSERRIATSDAGGRFVVEGLPAGEIALVIGTSNEADRGAAHASPTRVVVVPGQTVSVDLDLLRTDFGVLRGTILRAGRSLSGCSVTVASNSGRTEAKILRHEFLLAPITPGPVQLSLDLPQTPEPIMLLECALEPRERKSIDLTIDLGSIRGVVREFGEDQRARSPEGRNRDGEALEVALFEFAPGNTAELRESVGRRIASRTPDERNAFRFSAVAAGSYLLVASRGTGAESCREHSVVRVVADSESEVVLDLMRPGSIALRSNPAFDEKFAFSRLEIDLERADGVVLRSIAERTDPSGSFVASGIMPGMYRVTVRSGQLQAFDVLANFDVVVRPAMTTDLELPTPPP